MIFLAINCDGDNNGNFPSRRNLLRTIFKCCLLAPSVYCAAIKQQNYQIVLFSVIVITPATHATANFCVTPYETFFQRVL